MRPIPASPPASSPRHLNEDPQGAASLVPQEGKKRRASDAFKSETDATLKSAPASKRRQMSPQQRSLLEMLGESPQGEAEEKFSAGGPNPHASSSANSARMQRIGKPLDASKMKALKALPVIWQNPDLGKKQEGELKQYTIFNRSIYSSYRKISDKEKSNGLNHRYINSGGINVIVARQNPLASYYLKFPKHLVMDDPYRDVTEYDSEYDSEYDYLMDLAKLLNILNSKLCEEDPKTKAVRKHFAVEFIKEIRGSKEDPVPVFLTPAKRGFGLDSFVKEPKKYERHLPQGELKEKLDDMRKAIKWMHEAGFLHNDFQLP
ncbi:MAG TPA: hypothetical protein VIG66_04205, partial [Noviherbaspirillum sp.]